MRKQLGLGLCLVLLATAGCGRDKEQAGTKNTDKELVALEKWNQISLGNTEMVSWIEEIADTGKYLVGKSNFQTGEETIYLYKEQNGSLDQGTEVQFPDETYYYGQCHVAKDGKTIYFSAMPASMANDAETMWQQMKIYSGILEGNQVSQMEEVQELNEKGKILGEVTEDGTLLYLSALMEKEDFSIQVHAAKKDKDDYQIKEVQPVTNVAWEDISVVCEANDGDEKCLLAAIRGENGFVETILKGKWEGDKMVDLEEIILPDGMDGNIYWVSCSTDGEMVYFMCYNQDTQTSNVYRISTETLCRNKVEEEAYQECSFDAYDNVTFPLELRNKGNMQKKEGVYYEIFVRSFADSDGDGIGDLNGITEKLDYLKDLGVDGIWLTPILESPSYHGYDVTDYKKIKEEYGTEEDLKQLIKEAHKRKIKVIMDFVINHTSSEHPWFQSALSDEDSVYKNYYRWTKKADTADCNPYAKSPWNTRVWHKAEDAYYYGIFDASMPDLNYNNQEVREEIKEAAKKWLNLGLDGFRLDAALHIYGTHEFEQMKDSNAANMQWWNEFAKACEEVDPNVYLVGEAWDEADPLAQYTQPFDTKFNFTFAQDLVEAVKKEQAMAETSDTGLADRLKEIEEAYEKESGGDYLDGVFATNHDQDRVMSQVKEEAKAKLIANVYLTLPGNPFIYYGEELGMYGEGEDENKREPFLWSKSGKMGDTTWEADAQNENVLSVEEQKKQSDSMYWHYKNLLKLRKEHTALQQGAYEVYDTGNTEILGFYRKDEQEKLLVLHNFSGETVTMDCSMEKGWKVIYGSKQKDAKKVRLEAFESVILQVE